MGRRKQDHDHGRRRIHRLASGEAAAGRGTRSPGGRQLLLRHPRNLAELMGEPALELMRHDVTFPLYVEVDEIYHLACPASPVFYQRDPVQTTKTSRHWLDQHARTRQAHQGQDPAGLDLGGLRRPAGPSAARGPTGATSTRSGIRSCYDEGKRCAETLFFDYRRQHDMPIKVARIFNTYGPAHASGRRPGRLQLHRPALRASRSRSTGTAPRPARSATSTTWSTG